MTSKLKVLLFVALWSIAAYTLTTNGDVLLKKRYSSEILGNGALIKTALATQI